MCFTRRILSKRLSRTFAPTRLSDLGLIAQHICAAMSRGSESVAYPAKVRRFVSAQAADWRTPAACMPSQKCQIIQLSEVNDESTSAAQFTCRRTALSLHYDRRQHTNSTNGTASTIPADFGAAAAGS